MTLYLHNSSAGGIILKDDKVLVITSPSRGTTEFPKGTIEPDEALEETAVREVEEETGYRARIVADLGGSTYDFVSERDGRHYRKTVFYFLMELIDDNPPVANLQGEEDFEYHWLMVDEALEQLTFDDAKEMLRRALSCREQS